MECNTCPLVSILVPIYGVERYIERCAISLFEQSYENVEYVFVNDCTKDQSVNILEKTIDRFPCRKNQVKIIHHTANIGLAGSRLTGLKNAKGDYVWFVDSDDWVEKNAIELCVDLMREDYDMILFRYNRFFDNKLEKRKHGHFTPIYAIMHMYPPAIWKAFYKRSIFFENNIFPIVGIDFSEDYVMTSRIAMSVHNFCEVDKFLYNYNCQNVDSYWHNISQKYLEQETHGIIAVSEFYRNRCLKRDLPLKWGYAIFYSLAKQYSKLKRLRIGNECESLLSYEMFNYSTKLSRLFLCVSHFPVMGDLMLKFLSYYLRK